MWGMQGILYKIRYKYQSKIRNLELVGKVQW